MIHSIAKAGIPFNRELLVEVDLPTVVNGRSALRRLLQVSSAITAVMCTSDALALGVLAECRVQKLRVPQDISVTGYDDTELAAQVDPPLTTVKIPTKEISVRAVDMLMALISGQPTEQQIELEAPIVYRDSIAPARRAAD